MLTNTAQQSSLCEHCAMSGICFSQHKHQHITRSHKVYHRADSLFGTGQCFDALYILRSGSAKSSILDSNGQEQLTDFYFPYDLVGLDGFHAQTHTQTCTFLETSSVCRIGLHELDVAMANSSRIRAAVMQGMGHALNVKDRFIFSLNNMNSMQRLVSFLLSLSHRFAYRGLSNSNFDLSMTRVDIANYLGMAIETVSRLLTQLDNEQVIKVEKRNVSIQDMGKLQHCVGSEYVSSSIIKPLPPKLMQIQQRFA